MLVGRLVARSLLVTHSASAHARDVFAPDFRVAGLCRGASVVLACSEHLRAELERVTTKRDSEKIHVCRHGVDLSVLSPTPRRRIEAPLRILSVGRLVPKKGIDVLLEALARLKQRGVAFACRIAGDGPERERLLRRARGLPPGSVEFLGFQSFADMKDLYAWADVFALPCRVASDGDRDGVPNAILEAMASGVPVVASDAGGVSEVLTHKETGWLVPPNDPAALASALEEAGSEEELRSHLARGARAEVETRFDARKATETFVRLVVPAGRRE
jgi:glycosyltransferase involved in cell wall biosynthesis